MLRSWQWSSRGGSVGNVRARDTAAVVAEVRGPLRHGTLHRRKIRRAAPEKSFSGRRVAALSRNRPSDDLGRKFGTSAAFSARKKTSGAEEDPAREKGRRIVSKSSARRRWRESRANGGRLRAEKCLTTRGGVSRGIGARVAREGESSAADGRRSGGAAASRPEPAHPGMDQLRRRRETGGAASSSRRGCVASRSLLDARSRRVTRRRT